MQDRTPVRLTTILREWGRIGIVGFGGPPAHISLLRELCVERRGWISEEQFEHGIAATNLLPGPASTQLAIFCAWRLAGLPGALAGGLAFILPGLLLIIALAVPFTSSSPPEWIRGVGAGAGAVVAAVAVHAGIRLIPGSRRPALEAGAGTRWTIYLLLGALSAAFLGVWLVAVLLACGLVELAWRGRSRPGAALTPTAALVPLAAVAAAGGLLALSWTAFKVGALSYGGGFVIVPMMQADAVTAYGWMTDAEFLNAVALGQATPGPVTQTIAVVGYAAAGLGGALLASAVAFLPSFWFVLIGAERFDRLRTSPRPRAFLGGAGPAAVGAIIGAAVPLALALSEAWQLLLLAAGALLLLGSKLGVVWTLLLAAAVGAALALAGAPLPG